MFARVIQEQYSAKNYINKNVKHSNAYEKIEVSTLYFHSAKLIKQRPNLFLFVAKFFPELLGRELLGPGTWVPCCCSLLEPGSGVPCCCSNPCCCCCCCSVSSALLGLGSGVPCCCSDPCCCCCSVSSELLGLGSGVSCCCSDPCCCCCSVSSELLLRLPTWLSSK